MESEESDSQISRNTASNAAIGGGDEFGLHEVHSFLTDKLMRLSLDIDKYHSLEENNPTPEVVDLLKYKTRLLSCLSQELRTLHPQEWTRFSAHVHLDVMTGLKKEVQDLRNLLGVCQNQLSEDKNKLAGLEEEIINLQEMYENRQKNPEIHEVTSLVPLQKELSVQFNKHKRELHDMLQKLFPDDDSNLTSFLNVLCQAYFDDESGEPYITVDDLTHYPCLEMLLKADIITRHPHDKTRFRLTNFLQ